MLCTALEYGASQNVTWLAVNSGTGTCESDDKQSNFSVIVIEFDEFKIW